MMKPTLISLQPYPITTDMTSIQDIPFNKYKVTGYEVDFEFATHRFQFKGSCSFRSDELKIEEIQEKVLQALKEDLNIELEAIKE